MGVQRSFFFLNYKGVAIKIILVTEFLCTTPLLLSDCNRKLIFRCFFYESFNFALRLSAEQTGINGLCNRMGSVYSLAGGSSGQLKTKPATRFLRAF